LRAPLIFGLELAVLYAAGYYTMGRLISISQFAGGAVPGRMVFYLFIFPGVVLHESAHYLACLLSGTKVLRFAPFSPRRSADGRLVLGYVRHERRAFPIRALVGLAPILLNPFGILLVTTLLTPLSLTEVASPRLGTFEEDILASGFLTGSPLIAAVWVYLSLSLALGSVPSREDLSSVPALLLIFGGGVFLACFVRGSSGGVLLAALRDLSTVAAELYALPATVAALAALMVGLWGQTIR
jgi:hypothetical protein